MSSRGLTVGAAASMWCNNNLRAIHNFAPSVLGNPRNTDGKRIMLARLLDAWFSFVFGSTIKDCLAPALVQIYTWRLGPVVTMAVQHQDQYCNMRFALLLVAASTRLAELESV